MSTVREPVGATLENEPVAIIRPGPAWQALRPGAALLLAVLALSACMRHPAPTTSAATYQIVAAHSGQCLDVEGASHDDGARVLQWTCAEQPNQAWAITALPGDGVSLVARHSGKCLATAGAGSGDPDAVVQQGCAGDNPPSSEAWHLRPVATPAAQAAPGTIYQIVSTATGKCIDVEGSSKERGARIIQYACGNAAANQEWRLVLLPPS